MRVTEHIQISDIWHETTLIINIPSYLYALCIVLAELMLSNIRR